MKPMMALLLVFSATAVHADALADVRSAVSKLGAKQPVRATFATEHTVKSSGRFANANTERNVSADVVHDGNGVSISIPQSLIDKVAKSRRGGDDSAINLIGALRTINIVEAIDFREPFLSLTNGATLSGEQRVAFQGHTVRKLSLKLVPQDGKKDANTITIGSVKAEDVMTLWIGDDNLPIAAERVAKTTGGFMFMKGTFTEKNNYAFAHVGDRLVLARLQSVISGSGMGQKVDTNGVQTVTVH